MSANQAAVLQYIGARYVPKLYENPDDNSNNWKSGVSYESLTVVSYLDDSYTSKMPVPASVGDPAANPTYWAKTSNFNAALIALRNQANKNSNDITKLFENSNIKTRKILFIGDSYEITSAWVEKCSDILGHGSSFNMLSSYTGVSNDGYIYKFGRGGFGFTNNGGGMSSGNGFLAAITEVFTLIGSASATEIDDIVIIGGVNDAFYNINDTDWGLLHTNMDAFNVYARTNFPNANITIGNIGRVRGISNPSSIDPMNVIRCIYHYINEAPLFGWRYINNIEYTLRQSDGLIDNDNLHPTNAAGWNIATSVISGLLTGSCDIEWIPNNLYKFTQSGNMSGTPANLSCNINNGNVHVELEYYDGTFNDVSVNFNSQIKIGTQNAFYINKTLHIPQTVMMNVVGQGYVVMNVILSFIGYDVYLINRGCDSTGIGAAVLRTMSGNTQLAFDFPSLYL